MSDTKTLSPKPGRHFFFFLLGAAVLIINKVRYGIRGYREPRPFAPTEFQRAIDYDRRVVSGWLKALSDYTGQSVNGKVVLELGPGADLGPAAFLIDSGAERYLTVDANRLINQTPIAFYEELIKSTGHPEEIKTEICKTLDGEDDRIQYLVYPDFDLTRLDSSSVDLVVSQAAFEHFNNIDKTIEQLSDVVKPGGVLIAEVDLLTHTGAIRSRDPLNIYRYPSLFYKLVNYSGIPNRVRPQAYKEALERNGWYNVEVKPLQVASDEYLESIKPHLSSAFQKNTAEMSTLTFLLCATKQ